MLIIIMCITGKDRLNIKHTELQRTVKICLNYFPVVDAIYRTNMNILCLIIKCNVVISTTLYIFNKK